MFTWEADLYHETQQIMRASTTFTQYGNDQQQGLDKPSTIGEPAARDPTVKSTVNHPLVETTAATEMRGDASLGAQQLTKQLGQLNQLPIGRGGTGGAETGVAGGVAVDVMKILLELQQVTKQLQVLLPRGGGGGGGVGGGVSPRAVHHPHSPRGRTHDASVHHGVRHSMVPGEGRGGGPADYDPGAGDGLTGDPWPLGAPVR